jgi:hypothetical protein
MTIQDQVLTGDLTFEQYQAEWAKSLIPTDIDGASHYRVKALRVFETSRGVAWKASIHYNNKKIGQVDNDGNGGCNFYTFNTPEIRHAYESFVRSNYPETVYDRDDHFVEYLIERDNLNG